VVGKEVDLIKSELLIALEDFGNLLGLLVSVLVEGFVEVLILVDFFLIVTPDSDQSEHIANEHSFNFLVEHGGGRKGGQDVHLQQPGF